MNPRSLARVCVVGSILCLLGPVACRTPGPVKTLRTPTVPLDVSLLLEEVETTARVRQSMRARTRLSIEAPDLHFNRPQRVAVQQPGALRVEILALFHQVAAVLVVKDGRYQLWESGSKNFEEGPVSSSLLWRVARIALAPDDAIALLLGAPRPLEFVRPGWSRWEGMLFEVDLVDVGDRLRERMGFDAQGRMRRFERFTSGGELVWSATFDDHHELEGGDGAVHAFAHRVKLEFPYERAQVEIRFEDVELNAELAPALFELTRSRARADGARIP